MNIINLQLWPRFRILNRGGQYCCAQLGWGNWLRIWLVFGALARICSGATPPSTPVSPVPSAVDEPVALRSQSGQFIVRGIPMGRGPVAGSPTSQVAYVRIDPALMTVSCERIKQTILSELRLKDQWVGSISVFIHPVQEYDELIDVVSVRYRNGWNYRVSMPDQVNRNRLLKAVTQVLLQELSNRHAKERSAELPSWLIEGMTAHIQAVSPVLLTLEPYTEQIVQRQRRVDPLLKVREILRVNPPLTLNELSWPEDGQLSDESGITYRASAQFFVFELLRLKHGPAALGEMLSLLPQYHNWQTAFLRAFDNHFERLVDLDKWWALNLAHLTSRDVMSTWTLDEAMRQLDDALSVSAEVRSQPKDLPTEFRVSLQQVLGEWPYSRHTAILTQRINLLNTIRLRVPQELIGLVDNYRATLESYLKTRHETGEGTFGRSPLSNDKVSIKDAIRHLDELDIQRSSLARTTNTPPTGQLYPRPQG